MAADVLDARPAAEDGDCPLPAYAAASQAGGASVLASGDIDVSRIAMPEAARPYLMDMDTPATHGVAAFAPLWRELRTNDNVLNAVISGFRLLVNGWRADHGSGGGSGSGAAPDNRPITHVALNGGKLSVPWHLVRHLHGGIALALQRGLRCWLTELKTPWYRFFMDLDIVQPLRLRGRQIEAAVIAVQGAVRRYFPTHADADPFFTVVVCSTSYKPIYGSKEAEAAALAAANRRARAAALGLHGDGGGDGGSGGGGDDAAAPHPPAAVPAGTPEATPEAWKTGVHLIWPHIYVNNKLALIIREGVIAALAAAFGKRLPPLNSWEAVVDLAVHKGSGLRMMGNRKSDVCGQCKMRRYVARRTDGGGCAVCGTLAACDTPLHWPSARIRVADAESMAAAAAAAGAVKCPTCDGCGRVDTGRPYMPLFVADGRGYRRAELEAAYRTDFMRLMEDTAVRWRGVAVPRAEAPPDTVDVDDAADAGDGGGSGGGVAYVYREPHGQGFAIPRGAPLPVSLRQVEDADAPGGLRYEEVEARAVPRRAPHSGSPLRPGEAPPPREPTGLSVPLSRGDALLDTLQAFIRGCGMRKYSELRVTGVVTNRDRTVYIVNVHGPNCNFCHNVGREHTSNRIYFMFSAEDGMVQRCHNRSPTLTPEMRYGLCSAYRSNRLPLDDVTAATLFPAVHARAVEASLSTRGRSAALTASAAAGVLARARAGENVRHAHGLTPHAVKLLRWLDLQSQALFSSLASPFLLRGEALRGRVPPPTSAAAAAADAAALLCRNALLLTAMEERVLDGALLGSNAAAYERAAGLRGGGGEAPALSLLPQRVPPSQRVPPRHATTTVAALARAPPRSTMVSTLEGIDASTPASAPMAAQTTAPTAATTGDGDADATAAPEDFDFVRLQARLFTDAARIVEAACCLPAARTAALLGSDSHDRDTDAAARGSSDPHSSSGGERGGDDDCGARVRARVAALMAEYRAWRLSQAVAHETPQQVVARAARAAAAAPTYLEARATWVAARAGASLEQAAALDVACARWEDAWREEPDLAAAARAATQSGIFSCKSLPRRREEGGGVSAVAPSTATTAAATGATGATATATGAANEVPVDAARGASVVAAADT